MPTDLKLSVLDLTPVRNGFDTADALRNSLELARLADSLGYTRYWFAEHHNTSMLASAVPEIMIGQVAAITRHLRVGAGGIMLPNHAPLKVAESFKLLEALFPGRIDLGIGRAPGTDQLTALALRRSRSALLAEDFLEQLAELLGFLGRGFEETHLLQRIQAIPLDAGSPEIWMLGSSTYGARVAAEQGHSFAFAHHISPEPALEALGLYQRNFKPSAALAQARSMLAVSVICAETDEQANRLAASADLTFLRFYRQGGQAGPLPSVEEALAYPYSAEERQVVKATRSRLFVGSAETLKAELSQLAEQAGVAELMLTSLIYDPEARQQSYRLLAEAFGLQAPV